MHPTFLPVLPLLTLLTTALAQYDLLSQISFGHRKPLSDDGITIPNWTIHGIDPPPSLFSDRIQLTPPSPGNRRGAIWTQQPLTASVWDLAVDFRATGPDRAAGNLQFWLLNDKDDNVLSSVYTTEKFDGLVIVIDQYGNQGGSVRGFLNDRRTNFRQRQSIDALAFGHCTYPYRNLGSMSRLRVKQGAEDFEVLLDEQTCFQTKMVRMPTGYYFGISAASAEHPDAFEVAKFVVTTPSDHSQRERHQQPLSLPDEIRRDSGSAFAPNTHAAAGPDAADTMASFSSALQVLTEKVDLLTSHVATLSGTAVEHHEKLESSLSSLRTTGATSSTDQLNGMARRIEAIEALMKEVQHELKGADYQDSLQRMQRSLEETQRYLGGTLGENVSKIINTPAPRLGLFVGLILFVQIALAASYVLYKRRRATSPKKLL